MSLFGHPMIKFLATKFEELNTPDPPRDPLIFSRYTRCEKSDDTVAVFTKNAHSHYPITKVVFTRYELDAFIEQLRKEKQEIYQVLVAYNNWPTT